jgi:hypothetical protein
VGSFRTFLRSNRRLAALLVVLALAMKALVPAGYMLAQQTTVLSVTICADGQGKRIAHEITVPMKAGHADDAGDPGKGGTTCSWSSLAMGALGGAAPELLAALLVFILALGFRSPAPLAAQSAFRLRPPLRAPPVLA